MLGQGQAPRGPRGRARPAAGPDCHPEAPRAPHRAPEPQLSARPQRGAPQFVETGAPGAQASRGWHDQTEK